ncbi:cytochrome c peroxidase [Hymenobacter sp. M29]|uniref:Cytochrome c peroxidase n=1 Tax=Hymenobacter mellowenesis TaxID=3063995 RepID=A0ABT9A8D5_9BACT|nr:cytochrome c peroxidase [Hymenobacter sp. M29]MDO7846105.1 cytochrome c peroxidase [Hymenobacter sp. M29]
MKVSTLPKRPLVRASRAIGFSPSYSGESGRAGATGVANCNGISMFANGTVLATSVRARTMKKATQLATMGLLLLGLAGCKHDSDTPDPEGPLVPPTAYNLTVPTNFPAMQTTPADNPLTNEGVALGRQLFYEKALSLNSTVACASCHKQELAFSDGLARATGVNGTTTTRSSMSLANLAWERKLTWDGAATGLENQARIPIENPLEMHQSLSAGVAKLQATDTYPALFRKAFGSSTISEANVLKALAQFERTLISGNSRFDRFQRGDRSALTAYEQQGLILFYTHPDATHRGGNCSDCHAGDLQTDNAFRNNGLDATFTDKGLGALTGLATDNGKFRVPSLRNIALTAPYMHDGRFATLEQVMNHYNQQVVRNSPNVDPLLLEATNTRSGSTLDLTTDEKAQIVAFMRTLTDSTFIKDPRFAKP